MSWVILGFLIYVILSFLFALAWARGAKGQNDD